MELLRDPVDGSAAVGLAPPDADLQAAPRRGRWSRPIGPTDEVVSMASGGAYPVVGGVPILLRPERLSASQDEPIDIESSIFAEAYQEGELYSELAEGVLGERAMRSLRRIFEEVDPSTFPSEIVPWLDPGTTSGPYRLAMRHIGPVSGDVVLQIGGLGSHALRMIHAGAGHGVVVSPVVSELIRGLQMARDLGLEDRVTFVGGLAEELPLSDGSVSVVYSGSSMHHTVTSLAFPEIRRVLAEGGRFASVDVWKGRFHELGTRVFGKCHGNPYCSPLDDGRIAPAHGAFSSVTVTHHGCIVRYPLAVLTRIGVDLPPPLGLRLSRLEDAVPLGPLTEPLASIVCVRGRA